MELIHGMGWQVAVFYAAFFRVAKSRRVMQDLELHISLLQVNLPNFPAFLNLMYGIIIPWPRVHDMVNPLIKHICL